MAMNTREILDRLEGAHIGLQLQMPADGAAAVPAPADAAQFPGLNDFVVAMHGIAHQELRAAVAGAVQGLAPGAERLAQVIKAQLDGRLRRARLHAWVAWACDRDAALTSIVRNAERELGADLEADFSTLGALQPQLATHLFAAALEEVSRVERLAGGPMAGTRRALERFTGAGLKPQ